MHKNIQRKEFGLQQWQLQERNRAVARAGRKNVRHPSQSSMAIRPSSERKRQPTFIKLAEESSGSETDSDISHSSYDSFNERVTDRVEDTDDTDECVFGEIDEYELDYTSSSEDLFSNGSSSGTDDIVVKVLARAMFEPSSSSSDDFEILADDADTEESDAPTDPELGPADYWTCIKCKNGNNNPMYRFCEKCFQIRKTHFPPRPKHQKKRSTISKDSNGNEQKVSSESASSSGTDDKIDGRSSQNSNDDSVANIGKFMSNSSSSSKRRATKQNAARGHSAGDSSCCSSQELSPDEQQSPTSHSKSNYLDACASSQKAYCSEIERIVDAKAKTILTNFESNYPNSQESIFPSSSQYSSQLSTEVLTQSTSTTSMNMDLIANLARPVEITSSLSSGDFAPSPLTPMVSRDPDYTLIDLAKELHATADAFASAVKPKKPKKRKLSMAQLVSVGEDDDLIVSTAKKAKTMTTTMTTTTMTTPPPPTVMGSVTDTDSLYGMCIICLTQPKDAAFVHNRLVHVSCCYQCASKVWNKRKRCPVCNSQAKNVLKIFVH